MLVLSPNMAAREMYSQTKPVAIPIGYASTVIYFMMKAKKIKNGWSVQPVMLPLTSLVKKYQNKGLNH
jgi:hypothetical protein